MTYGAVIWKDFIVFKSKFTSNTLAAIIGPLLYLIAFGWGIGNSLSVGGQSYVAFVIPGIVAMNSMSISFNIIASNLNIARLYDKTFEAEMTSPLRPFVFTLAKTTVGMLRGLYSAALIMIVSLLFDRSLVITPYFALLLILNCAVFASIGIIVGLKIKSHADMAKVTNFVITPMSFLCGTLFPLDRFPTAIRYVFQALPLSQAVMGLRRGASAGGSWLQPVLLLVWLAIMLPIAVKVCGKAE